MLLLESISQSAIELFTQEGFQVDTQHDMSQQELSDKIADYHIVGIRFVLCTPLVRTSGDVSSNEALAVSHVQEQDQVDQRYHWQRQAVVECRSVLHR